jgi:hypothetical protein
MENDIPHKYQFFCDDPSWYVEVMKLVHILHNQISAYGKCLEHYHVQDIVEKQYDMQLVTIE